MHKSFFANEPSKPCLYGKLFKKIQKCDEKTYSDSKLFQFMEQCSLLLKGHWAVPEDTMALYFMRAEFSARLSLSAIYQKKATLACDYYRSAMCDLFDAAEITGSQEDDISEELLKKSNTYGLTNPIEAIKKIQEVVGKPLDKLLEQGKTTERSLST